MPSRVSPAIKARIPVLFYEQLQDPKAICKILGIKKTVVYDVLLLFRTYGVTVNPRSHRPPGRHRILTHADVKHLYQFLENHPCSYLDEMQTELLARRGLKVSISTLLRTLRLLHFSRKCVSVEAIERNDLDRSVFMNRIADLVPRPDMLMFIDEAAKNDRTVARRYGWSLKGSRCVQRQAFGRGQRWSILPVLTLDGIVAYDIIPGPVTSARFCEFLRDLVVCHSCYI